MAAKRKEQPPVLPLPTGYKELLESLKARIRSAQVPAALSANRELVLLYWHIGREILQRQQQEGWGAKVIERLARDLRQEFPEMKGLSRPNLFYMRAFAEAWPDEAIIQQLVGQIPWGHHCVLLDKVKDPEERLLYIQQTIEHGRSRNVPVHQIESRLCQRQARAITHFERTLRDLTKPMGVATYRVTEALPAGLQGGLPSLAEPEAELGEIEEKLEELGDGG